MGNKSKSNSKPNGDVSKVVTDFQRLPPEKQQQVIKTVSMSYSGPLPMPGDFAQYDTVLPGAADRILAMAENQAAHRQHIEKEAVTKGFRSSLIGQILAFLLGSITIVGGIILIAIGKDVGGYITIISAVVTLSGVFVYGRESEKSERRDKRKL